jgi:hypothetical protein
MTIRERYHLWQAKRAADARTRSLPTPTGKTHEYRRNVWGYSVEFRATGPDTIRGHLFSHRGLHEGDVLLLRSRRRPDGLTPYIVTAYEWQSDPGDMYFFNATYYPEHDS